MAATPIREEIPLGPGGVLHLAATPLSSFTLTSAEYPLDEAVNPLNLEGSCSNIPDGTTCDVLFARKSDRSVPQPDLERMADDAVAMKGLMRVSGGSSFKVLKEKPRTNTDVIELHVLEHELVGKGDLEVTIVPDLPGCNVGLPAPTRTFPYDNQVAFIHTPARPAAIGTHCTFERAIRTGAFANARVGLEIEEYDDPDTYESRDRGAASKDLHKVLAWAPNDGDPKHWWVGCEVPPGEETNTPAKVRLVYPEPDEIPPFEFAYYVHAEVDGRWRRLGYPANVFARAVPQPGITKLEAELVDKPPPSGPDADAVENAPDPIPMPARKQVRVELSLSEFAPDIAFPVSLRFWRAVDGDPTKIEPAGVPDLEDAYRTGDESRFFFKDTTLVDLRNCFVVLGFPGVGGVGATGTHVPITEILNFEARPGTGNLAFEEPLPGKGKLVDPRRRPPASIGVASAQANALLNIKDEIEDDIETLALAVCVFAEARDDPDFAQRRLEMKHVGGVILNRVKSRYRSLTTILDTVLLPDVFFQQDGTKAKTALLSKDPAQVKAWRHALKADDAIRCDESIDVARDLVDDPASNPFAAMPDGNRVNHFYSPKAWKGRAPEWAALRAGTCDADAAEVSIAGISRDHFRWYKGVH